MSKHDHNLMARLAGLLPRGEGEASHGALLRPVLNRELPADERSFVAAFIALLQGEEATSEHYIFLLRGEGSPLADLAPLLWVEAAGASLPGPLGCHSNRQRPTDFRDGSAYRVSKHLAARIGPRLIAALELGHLFAVVPHGVAVCPRVGKFFS